MEKCIICGHKRSVHWDELSMYPNTPAVCVECLPEPRGRRVHEFKLDNLLLIEDLAEERNLI